MLLVRAACYRDRHLGRSRKLDAHASLDLDDCRLERTLGFTRFGNGNPTTRLDDGVFWRAWNTPDGPATLRITPRHRGFEADAWGDGAERAIAAFPAIVGAHDDRAWLAHPVLAGWARSSPGLRLIRVPWLAELMWGIILQQRVAFVDAARSWRHLVRDYGAPAPGPGELLLAPLPRVIGRIPFETWFRGYGVDRRRAAAISDAAFVAAKIDRLFDEPAGADHLLAHLRGVGPWTRGMFLGHGLGDPDAVPIGDLHLPRYVSKALTGVPHGDDDKMLALLEPFAGQRFRAIRLLP
jgi:hypothetical protein